MSFFSGKRVLITGVCGTIGRELLSALLSDSHDVEKIVGIDNNESEMFFLRNEHRESDKLMATIADMRDVNALNQWMQGIDIVFHAAALKHVELCELSPFEAVQTNILGVQNVIRSAIQCGVERVIFTSSDKAVNPTNVMGTSKLMGERLITAANLNHMNSNTILASTRFGNVMGSSGSVIPVFKRQIESGGPVTLTDREMTRFAMSKQQAATLVLESAEFAKGGEVFITKMPVIRIEDLADVMVKNLGSGNAIDVIEIGSKPGEKLYEELMTLEETRRAIELQKYFVVLPAFRDVYGDINYRYEAVQNEDVRNPYLSSEEAPLSEAQLKAFLNELKLI